MDLIEDLVFQTSKSEFKSESAKTGFESGLEYYKSALNSLNSFKHRPSV